MNRFGALTRIFEAWQYQRRRFPNRSWPPCREIGLYQTRSSWAGVESPWCRVGALFSRSSPPMLFLLATVSLTSVAGFHFYNQPQLAQGTVAPQTIEATRAISIEDPRATEEKRQAVRAGLAPVLKIDRTVNGQVESDLERMLADLEQFRDRAGDFPFVSPDRLSVAAQRYLRQATASEWQLCLSALSSHDRNSNASEWDVRDRQGLWNLIEASKAIAELKRRRQELSQEKYTNLLARVTHARVRYQRAVADWVAERGAMVSDARAAALLDLTQTQWQEFGQGIRRAARQMLAQGIASGLPPDVLEQAIRSQLEITMARPQTRDVAAALLIEVLRPNLSVDGEQTRLQMEQAIGEVEPAIVEVAAGTVIVEMGETISHRDFLLLDALGLSRRGVNWHGLLGCGFLVASGIGLFCWVGRRLRPRWRSRDRVLLLLMSMSTPALMMLGIPYANLPAIGLLTSSFYGSTLAATQVLLLAGLGATTFAASNSMMMTVESLMASTVGGSIAAIVAGRLRSREELALLGGGIGLAQGGVHLLVNLLLASLGGGSTVWYALLPGAVLHGLSGLAWSVVALGISPYLERFFDLVTSIRLAELSNPNRPLLQRLAIEAPGTFQHTLFVASLAEAAARELGCNVELVRAGTLYHDIGKMHDPLGFVENQIGCCNKHDKLNDPYRSAQIIKKHVSEGLVIARKHGLPKAVQEFIPEHQGTLLISYFYFQARERAQLEGKPPVRDEDFRYDGPIPQSRETGVVMLADGCEAALRSLPEATPETALMVVNKILRARWQEGQLANSGLKREELNQIARVFVKVWQQSNHKRIAYPKAALEPQPMSMK